MLPPLYLLIEGSFFAKLFEPLSVSLIALFHLLDQNGFQDFEIAVHDVFDFYDAVIEEFLVEDHVVLSQSIGVRRLKKQSSILLVLRMVICQQLISDFSIPLEDVPKIRSLSFASLVKVGQVFTRELQKYVV